MKSLPDWLIGLLMFVGILCIPLVASYLFEPTEKKVESVESASVYSEDSEYSNCNDKYYCTEMINCEEAMYYFKTCGLKRLDADSDGIPCETLCL